MKIEIKEKPGNDKYPCIKRSRTTGTIVLFYDTGFGTVLAKANGNWNVGYQSVSWTERDFERFEGSITLSND